MPEYNCFYYDYGYDYDYYCCCYCYYYCCFIQIEKGFLSSQNVTKHQKRLFWPK